MTFGERLCELRKASDLTQEQLAKIVGVAKSTLTGYEKNNREPNLKTINALAAALGVTGNELLGIEDASIYLTDHEQALIKAYRKKPNMQAAVDRILGLDDEAATVGGRGDMEAAQEIHVAADEYRASWGDWSDGLTEEESVALVRKRYADAKKGGRLSTTSGKAGIA